MKEESIYPVLYSNILWYEKDCDELFVDMYNYREQLNSEGGVYLSEDVWIYPDGKMNEW
jgi:hypothetical protein